MARVQGFAAGSAYAPGAEAAVEWARAMSADPRLVITVTGQTDGSAADVDPATGSAALLAADRARAVAELLVAEGAVAPGRVQIATAAGSRRQVLLGLGFAGEPARDLLNPPSKTGQPPRNGD
jgi:flagellar motor protein MotB